LAKPNFEFQKRQKELEKKRKKEEKKQKKLDRAAAESQAPDAGATPPEST
jgi:Skp family chaperone for outer membrane proteins